MRISATDPKSHREGSGRGTRRQNAPQRREIPRPPPRLNLAFDVPLPIDWLLSALLAVAEADHGYVIRRYISLSTHDWLQDVSKDLSDCARKRARKRTKSGEESGSMVRL
jgi:hypothetical protein